VHSPVPWRCCAQSDILGFAGASFDNNTALRLRTNYLATGLFEHFTAEDLECALPRLKFRHGMHEPNEHSAVPPTS
jgi:hypothetical protein